MAAGQPSAQPLGEVEGDASVFNNHGGHTRADTHGTSSHFLYERIVDAGKIVAMGRPRVAPNMYNSTLALIKALPDAELIGMKGEPQLL